MRFNDAHQRQRDQESEMLSTLKVAPAELEELLLSHPSVNDAAVIGVPHLASGEAPKAFIVLNDRSTTADDIHKFLKGMKFAFWDIFWGDSVDIVLDS